MDDIDETRELQRIIFAASENLPDYCKDVLKEFIPYLKSSNLSNPEDEQIALEELESERSQFIEAVEKALQKKQYSTAIYLANNLAIFYESRSYLDEWLEVSKYALEAAINANDLTSKAYILGILGRVHRIKNMWNEAIDYCESSLSIYNDLNNQLNQLQDNNIIKIPNAETLDTLGNVYRSKGDPVNLKNAEKAFSQSIDLFREAGYLIGELSAWDGLGQVYTKQGKLDKAKQILENTLKQKRDSGDTIFSLSITLNNLGKVLRDLGKYDNAQDLFSEALDKKRSISDWRGEATTYNEIGILKSKIGDQLEALKMFEKSLDLKREKGDSHGQGLSLVEIGNLHYELGNTKDACESLIKAQANLTKDSEQYRETKKKLIEEILDKINLTDLSTESLDILEAFKIKNIK